MKNKKAKLSDSQIAIKAMVDYNSKITERKEPTEKQKQEVIEYFKRQGFDLYKTETLKPKLDKLALIEEQTRIVKQYEKQLKLEADYLLNILKNHQQDPYDYQKGYVTTHYDGVWRNEPEKNKQKS